MVTVDFTDPRANWEESDRASVPDGVCLRLYTGNYNGLYTNLTLEKSKVKGRDAHVSLSQLRALKASADLLCGGDLNALVAEGIERLAVATEEVKAAKEAAGVTKKAKPKTQGEIDGEKALDILKKYRQQTA